MAKQGIPPNVDMTKVNKCPAEPPADAEMERNVELRTDAEQLVTKIRELLGPNACQDTECRLHSTPEDCIECLDSAVKDQRADLELGCNIIDRQAERLNELKVDRHNLAQSIDEQRATIDRQAEELKKAYGRITALSLKEGRVPIADVHQQQKAIIDRQAKELVVWREHHDEQVARLKDENEKFKEKIAKKNL